MYAETGLMFPYFQNFSQEVQQFDEFCCSQKPNTSLGIPSSLIQPSTISDYNLGGEGDLFKAPEPVIGEAPMGIDPMMAAISMISCGEDAISPQSLTVSDIESSIESGQLLSEVFYECRKDLLAKQGNVMPLCEVLSIQIPSVKIDENIMVDEKLADEGAFQKSISSSCLRSMESVHEAPPRPRFLDFPDLDSGAFNRMRRAFSEGDIKTLDSDGNTSLKQSSMEQPRTVSSCTSEDRWEKLSRYWKKKSKRNFGRKIKVMRSIQVSYLYQETLMQDVVSQYACRKALADSQPRIRGRFAKTEEVDSSKMQ